MAAVLHGYGWPLLLVLILAGTAAVSGLGDGLVALAALLGLALGGRLAGRNPVQG